MILALDVHYRHGGAKAVGLAFRNWSDDAAEQVYMAWIGEVAPYEPGAFYRRELPCLLTVLEQVELSLFSALIVDGFAFLGREKKGLGALLYEATGHRVPVIGVAKSQYHEASAFALPLHRGESRVPLWITAAGMEVEEALRHVSSMAGAYRLPLLLRQLDQLTRS